MLAELADRERVLGREQGLDYAVVAVAVCRHRLKRRLSLRWRNSKMDCHAVRAKMAPAGAKGLNGWLRVSMYQIASVSLRASSICATLAPR